MKTSRTPDNSRAAWAGTVFWSPPSGPRIPPRAGYLLVQCLVYLSVIMILVGLALGAFYRAFIHSARLQRASTQILQSLQAGERWRSDVRAATGTIQRDENEGAAVLLLPQTSGEVAYTFRDQSIWRRSGSDQAWQPVLKNVKSARFDPVSRSRVQAWRWELELNVTNRPVRLHPLFTFQAVPGFNRTP